jgi:hypothetical protein
MAVLIRLLQPLRRVLQRIALRVDRKELVHGVPVVDWVLRDEDRAGVGEVRAAIELVRQYDPRRFRRIARDLDYVIVTNTAGTAGEYWPDIRSMLLDAASALRQTHLATAMTIVHEATHARLWMRGLGRYPDRGRIERVCVRAEIAFAIKVPGSSRVIEGARLKFASRYWEKSRAHDVGAWYRRFGWPRWLRG